MGVKTLGRFVFGTLNLGFFHRWRYRPDNALGHLVLQIEDVAEPTIKPIGPKMCPGGGIDELSRDAHSICRLANAPCQHVAHPKLSSHLLYVDGAPLIGEARGVGDDEQRLKKR